MTDTRTQTAIDEQASHWFALMLEPPLGEQAQQDFARWYHSDARHREAYAALRELWRDSALALGAAAVNEPAPVANEAALQPVPASQFSDTSAASARSALRPLRVWGVAAASMALALMLWTLVSPLLPAMPQGDYYTAVGEQLQVTLPDGSIAHLNSDSALALHYSEAERHLEVLAGDVWFEVAANPARPFRVSAAGGDTLALGTAFAVSLQPRGAQVMVTEHQVQVLLGQQVRPLAEGQALAYGDGMLGEVHTQDENIALAWRHQQLIFLGEPLAQVVQSLERWHSGKLVLVGSALAKRQVTLILDTREPQLLLDKLTQGLGLTRITLAGVTFIY